MNAREIDRFLDAAVTDRAFPGAAYAFGTAENVEFGAVGRHTYADDGLPTCWEMPFDLASVSKVAGTTSAALCLAADGKLKLDQLVREVVPEFRHDGVTFRNLLLHDSGLPAYANLQADCTTIEEARTRLFRVNLRKRPGDETVYSCLGFCVLREAIERLSGQSLDAFLRSRVFGPLKMESARYNPPLDLRRQVPPTEKTPAWRRKIEDLRGEKRPQDEFIQGSVHDPVAFMLGGVSGNAGLFASAVDLAKLAQEYLAGKAGIWPRELVHAWTKKQGQASSRALGWDTKSPTGSSAGEKFGPNSFGHTGYTGTTLWIDPDAKRFAVLLSNRVHPVDGVLKIQEIRPRFHDLVVAALGG